MNDRNYNSSYYAPSAAPKVDHPLVLKATRLSMSIALLKSLIGWIYYLKYLSSNVALVGGLFSSLHNVVFTGFPLAEQMLLLSPLRRWIGVAEYDWSIAKNLDVILTALHKLLNLGIVSTLLNWNDLNFRSVIYDASTTALIYTLIKGFWKIHFDYQLKSGAISARTYHWILPTLELIAFSLMPALMLGMTWAILLSIVMSTGGVLVFIRGHNSIHRDFETPFKKEKE